MVKEAVLPTTIVGIKRLAKQTKKATGVTYTGALDLAAKKSGYENFTHARRALQGNDNVLVGSHRIFLTRYWQDQKTYRAGRETLEVELSRPLLEVCSKRGLKLERTLSSMRLAAPDHLVADLVAPSQDFARGELCKAVRALRFMEATGLEASGRRLGMKVEEALDGQLPGRDHTTYWHDQQTRQFVIVDEPYSDAVVSDERAAWAQRNGWHLQVASWAGMYGPGDCPMFVASKKSAGSAFDDLMQRINRLAPPVIAENWQGMSGPYHEVFVSPMAVRPQDRRRARARDTSIRMPSKTTVPYRTLWSRRRKPVGAMGVARHQEAGLIIKALLHSREKPWSVNGRLDRLRSTLEDWLSMEISKSELQGPEFFNVYYGDAAADAPAFAVAETSDGVIELLGKLRFLLTDHYPDCAPLRQMIGRIDTAVKLTARHRERELQRK